MDRLFPIIPELLSPEGVFYLIIIKENDSGEGIFIICFQYLSKRGTCNLI